MKKSNVVMALRIPRGGAAGAILNSSQSTLSSLASTPASLFNSALGALAVSAVSMKLWQRSNNKESLKEAGSETKPAAIKALQIRFLAVFWLLRCADWLQGPYFYEVYASKMIGGAPVSIALISQLFLVGFASTAVFGPFVGRLSDSCGRRMGTLAYTALYTFGALSTKSSKLGVLFLGRFLNGIGTSLLFSAPESWLVGESMKETNGGKYLGETFGLVSLGPF